MLCYDIRIFSIDKLSCKTLSKEICWLQKPPWHKALLMFCTNNLRGTNKTLSLEKSYTRYIVLGWYFVLMKRINFYATVHGYKYRKYDLNIKAYSISTSIFLLLTLSKEYEINNFTVCFLILKMIIAFHTTISRISILS